MNKPNINVKEVPPDKKVFEIGLSKYNKLERELADKKKLYLSAKILFGAGLLAAVIFKPDWSPLTITGFTFMLFLPVVFIIEDRKKEELKKWEWAVEAPVYKQWTPEKAGEMYPEIANYLSEVSKQDRRLSFVEFEAIYEYWVAQGNNI